MVEHDPGDYATALSAKLAARSRHVCLFLGAGAARACGLPDVSELQETVRSALSDSERELFSRQLAGRNIELALSRLRRIAELVTGEDTVDGLTAAAAEALDVSVCRAIVGALAVESADTGPMRNLAAWVARASYRLPVEIFTVNYDLLLETALEDLGVPYFDGFVGNLRARFRTEIVEARPGGSDESIPATFARLWKLHGSVNWIRMEDNQIVRTGQPAPRDLPAAIYPSDAKYEESRRVPFVVLQDRLRRALHEPETLVLISGYSLGDAHLNEIIFDAATRRERSELVVFSYSELTPDLCERAARTPNLQVLGRKEAVLGGVRANWTTPTDTPPNLWVDGQFGLADFAQLAAYLARSSARDGDFVARPVVQPGVALADGANA